MCGCWSMYGCVTRYDVMCCFRSMPDVLVSNTLYMQYLSFYRQLLVDVLIKDNEDIQSTGQSYLIEHHFCSVNEPV